MRDEAQFNEHLAHEFVREYEKETSKRLRFKGVGREFPDAILEPLDGSQEIHAEFVEVALNFMLEELSDLDRYLQLFREVLQPHRPRFKNVHISLQPSFERAAGPRPARLPRKRDPRSRQVVRDFEQLMLERFEALLSTNGALLRELRSGSQPAYPLLTEYFDAIILNPIGDDADRKPHPDDPVIGDPPQIYYEAHIANAVRQAIRKKLDKRYRADVLLLHTHPHTGQRHSTGVAFHRDLIVEVGRQIAGDLATVSKRFKEVWFLNVWSAASEPSRRLFRLG